MNASFIRLKKEAHALFWPWCAVVIAGTSPIVLPHDYAEPFSFLSFFFGVPLLATLSLGNEFHHRTICLWLTQPLSRRQLLVEKITVMCPAVLSAGLVSGVVMFSFTWPHMRDTYKVAAAVYVIVAIAASTLWTLSTKSTPGALALLTGILFFAMLFTGGVDPSHRAPASAATITILSVFGACLATVTLWLGFRKLARFQVAGGTVEGDLISAGPALIPEPLAAWLRFRPSGAPLNLIRKEFRLLRPIWLMGLIVLAYVTCLAIFRLLPAPPVPEPRTVLEWVLLGPLVTVCIALAGLAGILSVGEEKTSGTQAWHMTLPISTHLQWLIKFLSAMFAGLICSLLLPVLAMIFGGSLYGSPLMYVNLNSVSDDIILFASLSFTCFWCACAANGTVRAAGWAPAVAVALALAAFFGLFLGKKLATTTGTLQDLLVSSFHLSPTALTRITDSARGSVLWLFIPALLFAVVQSYWLYRAQPDGSFRHMMRSILPLVAVTFLWTFSASAGILSSTWEPFAEIGQALNVLKPAAVQQEISGEELAASTALTAPTRRWLKGSRLTISSGPAHSLRYPVNIRLAGGLECKLTIVRSGSTVGSCKD